MNHDTSSLAHAITRAGSKQSYLIARLLVDRDLVDHCLRAYAYFRWADDEIDVNAQSVEERLIFIEGQKTLIGLSYQGERPSNLRPEEAMIVDLIAHDQQQNSGLQSFIYSFIEVLEFDAKRKDELISQTELTWYSHTLGQAVTDAIQFFIGNDHAYPNADNHYLAATAAHISHMLRDMVADLNEGFINIPSEWLAEHEFASEEQTDSLGMMNNPAFCAWVKGQVQLARALFQEGKKYLDELDVLRCKIAGYWYCARFECVLDAIERDRYVLRREYHEREKFSFKLKMGWLAASLSLRHIIRCGWRRFRRVSSAAHVESLAAEH